jgi:hypothetical protein
VSTARGTWHPSSPRTRLRVWQASQVSMRDWRPSPYTGPLDVFARPPASAPPATAVQRTHECSTGGQLPGALRELLG